MEANKPESESKKNGKFSSILNSELIKEKLFVVIAAASQILFQKHIFVCPHKEYKQYGLIVLLSPTIPLFSIALLLNSKIWEVVKSLFRCCTDRIDTTKLRSRKRFTNNKPPPAANGDSTKVLLLKFVYYCLVCLLAPLIWVVLCLLRKKMYVCAMVGPAMYNGTDAALEEVHDAGADSMKLGLLLLQVVIGTLSIAVIMKRCCIRKKAKRKNIKEDGEDRLMTYKAYELECAKRLFRESAERSIYENTKKHIEGMFTSLETSSSNDNSNNNNNNNDDGLSSSSDEPMTNKLAKIWENLKETYPELEKTPPKHVFQIEENTVENFDTDYCLNNEQKKELLPENNEHIYVSTI